MSLWFAAADAISIHTLVAAAHRVVHDVAEYQGSGAVFLDRVHLESCGFDAKAFKKAIREAETFFKHAEKDHQKSYTFSATQTEYLFYSAIECFHRITSGRSRLLATYMAWFHFRHPDTLSERARDKFADVLPEIHKLSRAEFLEEFSNTDFRRHFEPE